MQNVSLGEVMTPIRNVHFRGWRVSLKLEYVLPTGSYKDRGIAVCMTHLKALGVKKISEDSSGNAGASTAAYAAAAGIQAGIYVPEGTSPAKLGQIAVYGAELNEVAGTRSVSAKRAQDVPEGCRYIGHSWNPFFACGIKTIAYEIAEQTNWSPPDWIATPLGGGSLVLGLIDGFEELLSAGYIQKSPRILAVQSEACAPIYRAWIRDSYDVKPVTPQSTYAEGVALPSPARGSQILESIRRNNGIVAAVNDEDLLSSWKNMAHLGYLIEPTSAVAVAGAWQARQRNQIGQGEDVLIVLTGNGLKTKPALLEGMISSKL
ncbi:hypothetical protein PRZ48_009826 [Zasmidium cellare]|uniref:Tryptophan synthase beta chain-like PALP domain-containing protein n=1 Tax=Zasmidium cellare TaxID=395010 RepID=A0ABR0EE23_ZASCE|nr:hypothetical protein PRZ48_009826 [Zasmidium cellare]